MPFKDYCTEDDVRLMEGENWEGRLEICSELKVWNRVHSERWTPQNTRVVCGYLGYEIGTGDIMIHNYDCIICTLTGEDVNLGFPQAQSKPLYANGFNCSGTELSLLQCHTVGFDTINNIVVDTEISCQRRKHLCTTVYLNKLVINSIASCSDGDLKLVGGESESDGRLEICLNKRWTTINGRGWTKTDTKVACNQLNYSALGYMNIIL